MLSGKDSHVPMRLHLLMAVVFVCFLVMVGHFIVPVLLGACLAGVAMPIFHLLRRHTRTGPATAAGITTAALLCGVLLPFIMLTTAAVRAVVELVNDVTRRLSASAAGGENVAESLFHEPWVLRLTTPITQYTPVTEQQLREVAATVAQKVGVAVGQTLGSSLQETPQAFLFLFILLVALYYFMVDGTRFEVWLIEQSPFTRDVTINILEDVKDTSARTLLSSAVVSAVQSSLIFVGMLITGIPAPFIWFTVAFMMAFLPLIGTVPLSVGCMIYLVAQGSTGKAGVMLVLAILAGLSDNVVRPAVIGSGDKQHPLITLISIFGGLWMLGFPGLFLGPVLASLFLALLDRYSRALRPPPPEPEPPGINMPAVKHDA